MINNLLTLRTGKVQTDAMIIDFNDFFKPISDIHTKKPNDNINVFVKLMALVEFEPFPGLQIHYT